ncbi:hypothetical protein DSM3645_28162 [Blastopirellula marina DSM 3645]|uniref:Transposase n=1 Tax=Blastopirellula marina DSM 3645 TaxID=314230 RepID=A3ZP58_9BACT|nr:hypothetical protein DSM3645_28162 [Blastopirellula marina DSM 3645]
MRGIEKVRKRWTIQAAARNLGLILRTVFGIGTARSLQDLARLFSALYLALILVEKCLRRLVQPEPYKKSELDHSRILSPANHHPIETAAFSTGC